MKSLNITDDEGAIQTIKIGDRVGFKRDIESNGTVTGLTESYTRGHSLTVETDEGEYGGSEEITLEAGEFWVS
tara:strand:+ start:1776 stop:1994 length:219 start_codon:yes stop_codon:yes gene_type:complete